MLFPRQVLLALLLTVLPSLLLANELPKANLMLQWTPQAQFAGYLMAQEKGFYRQHGIDLTLIPGGPDRQVSDYLADGRADFGMLFLSTALDRCDKGLPLVNIAQMGSHSSLLLVVKANSGIESIEDLNGSKVSLWANEFQIQPRLLFQQAGITVHVIAQSDSLALFQRNVVTATSAMWYNEYHTLLSSGLRPQELKPFFFRDTDFDFPEDGIYCLKSTLQNKTEIATAIREASIEGWRYAFEHEEETLDVVIRTMTEASLPVSRVHQRWMLKKMHEVLKNDLEANQLGLLDRDIYQRVVNQLQQQGWLQKLVDYDAFFFTTSAREPGD